MSDPDDAVLTQLAKPVLVLSALPNAETPDLDPSIRWQAGMQGRAATICIPVAADAPIVVYMVSGKWECGEGAGRGLGI